MRAADNNLSPKTRLALWDRAWPLVGLAAAAVVNLAWIGLLAYALVQLL